MTVNGIYSLNLQVTQAIATLSKSDRPEKEPVTVKERIEAQRTAISPAVSKASPPNKSRDKHTVMRNVLFKSVLEKEDSHALSRHLACNGATDWFTKDDFTASNEKGNTLLHVACINGHPNVVRFIFTKAPELGLKLRSLVNFSNCLGEYPLFLAGSVHGFTWDDKNQKIIVNQDMLEVIRLMLNEGAVFCDKMNHKQWFQIFTRFNVEALKLIFAEPMSQDILYVENRPESLDENKSRKIQYPKESLEYTLLDVLSTYNKDSPAHDTLHRWDLIYAAIAFCLANFYIDSCVSFLKEKYPDATNETVIGYIRESKSAAIQTFLNMGGDQFLLDKPDVSLLAKAVNNTDRFSLGIFIHHGIRKGDIELVTHILNSGVYRIDYIEPLSNNTALHVACDQPSTNPNAVEIVNLLMQREASYSIMNRDHQTAKDKGIRNGYDPKLFPVLNPRQVSIEMLKIIGSVPLIEELINALPESKRQELLREIPMAIHPELSDKSGKSQSQSQKGRKGP